MNCNQEENIIKYEIGTETLTGTQFLRNIEKILDIACNDLISETGEINNGMGNR